MNLLKVSLLAVALAAAPAAHADSQLVGGSGKLSARASLDFAVTIPQILMLQVGASGSVSQVTFDLSGTPTAVGTGAVAGTGGDLGDGKVSAKLVGNVGTVNLSSTTTGALTNADGDQISYSKILATSSNSFAPPSLADNATTTIPVTASGKLIDRSAEWTFTYANDAVVAPGTYGGGGPGNTGNGRVIYTAAMP